MANSGFINELAYIINWPTYSRNKQTSLFGKTNLFMYEMFSQGELEPKVHLKFNYRFENIEFTKYNGSVYACELSVRGQRIQFHNTKTCNSFTKKIVSSVEEFDINKHDVIVIDSRSYFINTSQLLKSCESCLYIQDKDGFEIRSKSKECIILQKENSMANQFISNQTMETKMYVDLQQISLWKYGIVGVIDNRIAFYDFRYL